MDYRVFRLFDSEPIDAVSVPLEVHVLARAYGKAWRALHSCEPVGRHFIECLGLTIDFGSRSSVRQKREIA
jgi:hypothetical protein